MNRGHLAAAIVIGLILPWSARASAALVAVVSSAQSDCAAQFEQSAQASRNRACVQEVDETVTRLAAELDTAGFSVVTLPRAIGSDLSPSNMELDPVPVGVFSVMPVTGSLAIEVLLTDRSTNEVLRFTLRAPQSATARAPALLAVRALELLRANALVLDLAGTPPPLAPSPPAVVSSTAPTPSNAGTLPSPPRRARFVTSLGGAAAALYGFDNLGPALAPLLTAQIMGGNSLGARLVGVGPSLGPKLRAKAGRASVSEALVALAVDYELRPLEHLALLLSVGAGVHHLSVRGHARAPFVATRERVFSALGSAGVAAHVPLRHGISLTLDLLAYVTFPRPVVHVAEDKVGAVSRPSTLSALGLLVEL